MCMSVPISSPQRCLWMFLINNKPLIALTVDEMLSEGQREVFDFQGCCWLWVWFLSEHLPLSELLPAGFLLLSSSTVMREAALQLDGCLKTWWVQKTVADATKWFYKLFYISSVMNPLSKHLQMNSSQRAAACSRQTELTQVLIFLLAEENVAADTWFRDFSCWDVLNVPQPHTACGGLPVAPPSCRWVCLLVHWQRHMFSSHLVVLKNRKPRFGFMLLTDPKSDNCSFMGEGKEPVCKALWECEVWTTSSWSGGHKQNDGGNAELSFSGCFQCVCVRKWKQLTHSVFTTIWLWRACWWLTVCVSVLVLNGLLFCCSMQTACHTQIRGQGSSSQSISRSEPRIPCNHVEFSLVGLYEEVTDDVLERASGGGGRKEAPGRAPKGSFKDSSIQTRL